MEEKNLPKEWIDCDLNELLDYVTSGSRDWSQYYSDKGVNFIRTQDINQNRLDLSSVAKVTLPEKVEGKRTLVLENDILITITGANVGKCARVDISPPESYVSQSVALVRLVNPSMSAFIQRQIIAPVGDQTALQKAAYGMGRPVLNLNNIRDFKVKLPPLAEQEVIAEKLDNLLAQVDNTKSRLERIPEILKSFRQSVLAAAVSGKLTEDWIGNESTLDDIAEFQNGFAFKSQWFEQAGNHQVIKLGNIRDGYLALENSPSYVSDSIAKELSKFTPNKGDTLLSMTGTRFKRDYGFGCLVNDECNLLINQRVGRLIPNKAYVLPTYLNLLVRSEIFRAQFFEGETGGVNQGNVGSKHIMSIKVLLPSIIIQTEIVRRVEELFAFADRIERAAQAAQSRVNNLTQSILAKAFRGELTADWRTANPDLISGDNSAEALLAKIKAEREKLAKKTRAKA